MQKKRNAEVPDPIDIINIMYEFFLIGLNEGRVIGIYEKDKIGESILNCTLTPW